MSITAISVTQFVRARSRWLLAACTFVLVCANVLMSPSHAADGSGEVPLIMGNRTIHVFRASLGAFTAEERAEGARQRIASAIEGAGEGWTSVKSSDQGVMVLLDGKPMFTVANGDARKLSSETQEDIANNASRVLQKVWSEARESRDPQVALFAAAKVALAAFLLAAALALIVKISRLIRSAVTARVSERLNALPVAGLGSKIASLLLGIASRSCVLFAWLLSMMVVFAFLTYSLEQFVLTRPIAEGLSQKLTNLLVQGLNSMAGSIPGLVIAVGIFLAAWIATQISSEVFNHVSSGQLKIGMLDAHTAPATRRIANASLWLFALAMAYPYLPGAQTEAFKGLSVILGLMVSIGTSGLIGQVASGVILVYTRALSLGEFVRIQDCEGTVTELGLFVTRLRTGLGEEVALPNALVLANVTRNFSRATKGNGFVLDTAITIGYDTPWRQVHAMLLEAAGTIPDIAREPAPYVVQTALSDFYVAYKLVVYAGAEKPAARARVASDLHAAIQDVFNRHDVQIMSPHYQRDPTAPKTVPESAWYVPPAVRPPKSPQSPQS